MLEDLAYLFKKQGVNALLLEYLIDIRPVTMQFPGKPCHATFLPA